MFLRVMRELLVNLISLFTLETYLYKITLKMEYFTLIKLISMSISFMRFKNKVVSEILLNAQLLLEK